MKTSSPIETLESRIAPASVIFTDQDGDKVKFATSQGDLTGLVTQVTVAGKGSVYGLDLTDAGFDGTNLTVSVSKAKQGDGIAIIGNIHAGTNNLGTVRIEGDLGGIDAGNGTATIAAIRSLKVDSFGRFGAYGDGDSFSAITGNVNSLVVKHDFSNANLSVIGDLHSVRVGGSVIGGANSGDGQIYASGEIGSIVVGGDLRGGDNAGTGAIGAGGDLGSVTIRGSVFGGAGDNSGQIFAGIVEEGTIRKVSVGESVVGGTGRFSGIVGGLVLSAVTTDVSLGTITIGNDLVGGGSDSTGAVHAFGGGIDSLTIKGSFIGGPVLASGLIFATEDIGTLSIRGHVLGGMGDKGARILAKNMETVNIGKSFVGGHGVNSGEVFATGDLGKITVGGDLRGGDDDYTGGIVAGGNIGQAIVKGSIYGGTGTNSGSISAAYSRAGQIEKVTVEGSVYGGSGISSGTIGGHEANFSGSALSIGTVIIGGNLIGGTATDAGSVTAHLGSLDRLTIKGSVIGGLDSAIAVDGRAGSISIGGSVLSAAITLANGADSLSIRGSLIGGAANLAGSVTVNAGGLGLLKILGDVRGGAGPFSGSVNVIAGGIGTRIIGGVVIPGTGAMSGVIIG
jgi:hypothetical protein